MVFETETVEILDACRADDDDMPSMRRYEEPLLRPLLAERLRGSTEKFDTIHLVDFRYGVEPGTCAFVSRS